MLLYQKGDSGMQNEEIYIPKNRSELIKQARESCTKNLYSNHNRSLNSDQNKKITKVKDDVFQDKKIREQPRYETINGINRTTSTKLIHSKFFFIRVMVAIVIFLFIVAIDQFNLSYQQVNSNVISEVITSNETVNTAVDLVSSFTKNKIFDVFNGLGE